MKSFLKKTVKMLITMMLGLVYMWFMLSFAWSLDDMSVAEKIVGVAYAFWMMSIYEGMKKVLRLS